MMHVILCQGSTQYIIVKVVILHDYVAAMQYTGVISYIYILV